MASYPKSGNTWLRAFLANLVADTGQPLPLAELSRYCEDEALPDDYFAHWPASRAPNCRWTRSAALRPRVHQRIADRHPATVFVKTHNMVGSYDGHRCTTRRHRAAIYVVRNPLDVAVSLANHFGIRLDEAIDYMGSRTMRRR